MMRVIKKNTFYSFWIKFALLIKKNMHKGRLLKYLNRNGGNKSISKKGIGKSLTRSFEL